jgi:hypothetical protein
VPFVRASRDKRGYEHFFLVQNGADRGKGRPSVLYWFRTPPNVKVGREPFDDSAARALEAQHPDITFDWEALRNTPAPTAQPEYWRERRRVQRAERRLREADERESDATAVVDVDEEPGGGEAVALAEGAAAPDIQPVAESFAAATAVGNAAVTPSGGTSAGHRRHRRRRRRRGRHPGTHSTADSLPAQTTAHAPSSSSLGDPTSQPDAWQGRRGDNEGE